MANVLPPEQLHNVWRFYRARFLIVGALLACICAVIALIALAPSFILLWTNTVPIDDSSNTAAATTEKADRADLQRMQTVLTQLAPTGTSTTSPTQIIARALSARPKGIAISNISYTVGKQTTIVFSGTAQTRESLTTFQKALQNDPMFTSVSVPVSDLVGGSSNTFSLTLAGHF